MDTLTHYRDIVRKVICEYASYTPSHGCIKTEAIIDPEKEHGCVVHIDIIDAKVWIQYDGTSSPVADALLAAGIPREAIVLGFHPSELRQYTDFAVAK